MQSDPIFDVIIIGGGHNGLTAAAYLARAGRSVLVLERRPFVGGAAITGELAPGYRISTASYLISLLLPEIERELDLKRHGYKVLPRDPSSFTPLEDGRSLLLGADTAENAREIAKFSAKDAQAYPRYEALLTRIAEALEPVMMETPADLLPLPRSWRARGVMDRLRQFRRGHKLYKALATLGEDQPAALEILGGAARPILERWFESEPLRSTLATDAIIGTFQPPSSPGTAYVLLHHVMGQAGGARGIWGYVEGGMGALTQAIAAAAREAGAQIRTGVTVAQVEVEDGRACGVRLAGGEVLKARAVASNADAHVTFEKLTAPQHLPAGFRDAVARIDYSSASMKINFAVKELPDFKCMPGRETPLPHHRGTLHFGASLDAIERAYDDAKYGRPSLKPIMDMTIPSTLDTTLAPKGQHVVGLFVQYAPYKLAAGTWDSMKEGFADRCVAEIDRLAPNFGASILHREVISPLDLERTFGLTGGNIFQGAMSLHQLFSLRPVAGWSDYRTPLRGLYLCGAAAHPGGGVMGAAGRNAAVEILRDL